MINADEILKLSNGGLDILVHYYPQIKNVLDNPKKPFDIRGEKTPSTYIKEFKGVWKITDFGDDARAKSPFDVAMEREGVNFYEALCIWASILGIGKNYINESIAPTFEVRNATPEETKGYFNYEKKDFSAYELEVFGHKVEAKHMAELNYASIAWYSMTKEKEGKLVTTVVKSNDKYPIYVRECGDFVKVYQPLAYDKKYRFFYQGKKPLIFVNGLSELMLAYTKYNENERAKHESDPLKETAYKEKKLSEAVFCSGERDAVNCLSYGYYPLWLNSETDNIDYKQYFEICKYAATIYNIPDIDETGIKKGIEFGLKFLELRTVKIPKVLNRYNDIRGRGRKDLRDYVELNRSKKDFENLINRARPYQFWETVKGKNGEYLEINTEYLLNFLIDMGFGKFQDKVSKKETLVKIQGNIINEITSKDIRAYVVNFVRERVTDVRIINLVLNSARTKTVTMDDLPIIDVNLIDNTADSQFFFFKNEIVEVKAEGIITYKNGKAPCYVFDNKVNKTKFRRLDKSFKINQIPNGNFDIDITNIDSHYFRYIINSSRIFWREELEHRSWGTQEAEEKYRNEFKFAINGPRLAPEEVLEQKQNLIAKIFTIGYLMHRYKALSKTWAVWIMEDKIAEDGQSLGGTGKSFMVKFMRELKDLVSFGGRNKKLTENNHIFERITRFTDIMLVDDADQYIDFNFFYGIITGDMEINEKNVKSKELTYEETGKLVFTSNFPPRSNDSSTARRLLYVVFSDWYHQKTDDNDYLESRAIRDDFGYDLCDSKYSEDFWNQDFNFVMDCMEFYLRLSKDNIKLQPPMHRVMDRMNIQTMGNQFKDWADVFFSPEGSNLNKYLVKKDVFTDFQLESNIKAWSTKQFSKALQAYCKHNELIQGLNPKETLNDQGRLIRKVGGATKEMIYVQTVGMEVETYTDLFY